jgi:hypothetical protein
MITPAERLSRLFWIEHENISIDPAILNHESKSDKSIIPFWSILEHLEHSA